MNERPKGKPWSMSDPGDRETLLARIRRAAAKVCRGPADFEDTVQDMALVLMECQATEPGFARQAPSYQVKRAFWRVQDKRRREDREARHLRLDEPLSPGSDVARRDLVAGGGPAQGAALRNLTRAAVRCAVDALAAGDDPRAARRYELVVRRFFHDQTVAEAARQMGIPKGSACMYSSQAFEQLRAGLRAWCPDERRPT